MQLRQDLKIKQSCGIHYIYVPAFSKSGAPIVGQIVRFNDASEMLWNKLQALPAFTLKDAVAFIQEEYEIDEVTATEDCKRTLTTWINLGLVTK